MKVLITSILAICLCFCCFGCEEAEESVDDNNDIVVRNSTDRYLYIMIDGSERGVIENNGIAHTMWDGISDGIHTLQAYKNDNYTDLHCTVSTDFLDDGEDFYWYLEANNEYSGTRDGNC